MSDLDPDLDPGTGADAGGPLHACPVCEATFRQADHQALHFGRVHPDALDADQRARFEEAMAREQAWLSRFRSHLAGALSAAAILLFYVGIILSSYVLRANPAFIVLPAPGIIIFAVVTYYLVYKHRRDVETRPADA